MSAVVVDDYEIVRVGLRAILREHATLELIGESAGDAACQVCAALQPHIVVLDAAAAGSLDDLIRRVLAACPAAMVIVFTGRATMTHARGALAAGARGYALKRTGISHLCRALDVVAAGGLYLDPLLATKDCGETSTTGIPAPLSPRETTVASLTALGHTSAEIAARLEISVKTVDTHRSRTMAKLGITTRAELVRYALGIGWFAQ